MSAPLKRGYPRALPYRAPDELSVEADRWQEEMQDRLDELTAQASRWRRWSLLLLLALAGAVGVAALFYYRSDWRGRPAPAALASQVKAPASAAPPVAPAPPKAAAPDPEPPPPPQEFLPKETALEALGGLSAANLYQSYLTINLLADGVGGKAFTREGATDTLRIVAGCSALVETKLARLDDAALEPDDRASLKQIKAVTALLRVQLQTLETTWGSGKTQPGAAYQRARQASWTALSKVLGIKGG